MTHVCEVDFVVSFITMYNMWCLLYRILKLLLDITIWNILHYKNQILNMMDLQFCIQDLESNIFFVSKLLKLTWIQAYNLQV